MAGIKKGRIIQLGIETTKGTEVDATVVWRGTGTMEDKLTMVFPEEDVGIITGTDRSYVPKVEASLDLDPTPATYEQLPYLLACSIKNVVTGAADGAGTGKIYSYTFHTLAASLNTIKTLTVEAGDNQQEEQMLYAFCDAFKLSGKPGEALMMSGHLLGRQVAAGTYTASVAIPTVEEILFSKGVLSIDTASGGTYGQTPVSLTLLGADVDVKPGWVPVYSAEGFLYFSFEKAVQPEVTVSITFEHNANVATDKAFWRAGVGRLLRLKFTGTTLTTAGSTYSAKTLIIDFSGKWEKFDKIAEQNGNDVVTGLFRARYDPGSADFGKIIVVVDKTAL